MLRKTTISSQDASHRLEKLEDQSRCGDSVGFMSDLNGLKRCTKSATITTSGSANAVIGSNASKSHLNNLHQSADRKLNSISRQRNII
jgi:hypothetical protein